MNTKKRTFEERLSRLQEIVTTLESGNSPLEASVTLYKEGLNLAAACREELERAKHEIQVCTENGVAPFSPEQETTDGA